MYAIGIRIVTTKMATELTKDQLLDYVRKQKIKIKKLETDIASLKESVVHNTSIQIHDESTADVSFAASNQVEQERSQLHSEIQSLQKQLQDSYAVNTKQQTVVEEMKMALASRTNDVEKLRMEMAELQRWNEECLMKAKHCHAAQLTALEEQLIESRSCLENQTKELETSRRSAVVTAQEVEELNAKLREIQSEYADRDNVVSQLKQKLDEYETKEACWRENDENNGRILADLTTRLKIADETILSVQGKNFMQFVFGILGYRLSIRSTPHFNKYSSRKIT